MVMVVVMIMMMNTRLVPLIYVSSQWQSVENCHLESDARPRGSTTLALSPPTNSDAARGMWACVSQAHQLPKAEVGPSPAIDDARPHLISQV